MAVISRGQDLLGAKSYNNAKPSSIEPRGVSAREANIPLFDLSLIDHATGVERKEMLAGLIDAFVMIGFGALYVPHLSEIHKRIFSEAHSFFSRTVEDKQQYTTLDSLGYVPYGKEQLRGEVIALERYRYVPKKTTIPKQLGAFKNAVEEISCEYNKLATLLSALFAEGIGMKKEDLPISDNMYTMSIKHYPKPSHSIEIVHPHHRDISPITILPAGTEAGLQMLKGEKYEDIVIPEGYVIANTGEILCNKTAGFFYGPDHRVVKKSDWSDHGRYQIALFAEFPEEFSLAPFPSLIDRATKEMSSTQREAFIGQFMTGTLAECFEAYQINVIGEPTTAERVDDLIGKGFLRNPSNRLKEQFPGAKWGMAEAANLQLLEMGLKPLFTSSIS